MAAPLSQGYASVMTTSLTLAATRPAPSGPTIGLALGAGGARGVAHIPVFEALDDFGVRPAAIAGTSIGAIFGAAYAAGLSGRDLRQHVGAIFRDQASVAAKLLRTRVGRFVDLFGGLGNPVMVDGQKILEAFWPQGIPETFEDLPTPFTAIATNLFARDEVQLSSGDLRSAVAGSMAIPGLIKPVERDGLVLIDGVAVNPVPVDAVTRKADIVIAIDLNGRPNLRVARTTALPSAYESLFAGFQIMEHRLTIERLAKSPPAIHLVPNVSAFGVLDFLRATAILRAAEPIREELKAKLGPILEAMA